VKKGHHLLDSYVMVLLLFVVARSDIDTGTAPVPVSTAWKQVGIYRYRSCSWGGIIRRQKQHGVIITRYALLVRGNCPLGGRTITWPRILRIEHDRAEIDLLYSCF
jgi:hypothetical protein